MGLSVGIVAAYLLVKEEKIRKIDVTYWEAYTEATSIVIDPSVNMVSQ